MPTEHHVRLPCPVGNCRANHLTQYGAAQHLRRAHGDVGRWGPEPAADGGVTVSAHARERWRSRSKQTKYGPRGAWESGVSVWQFPADAHRVRYHAPTRTVLLAKNDIIVTVLAFEEMSERRQGAVRRVESNPESRGEV